MVLAPNPAYLAAFAGLALIILEMIWPGVILPAVGGVALLVWGGYGLWHASLDSGAVALLLAGVVLLFAEALWNSRYVGAAAALACLGTGSYRLVARPPYLHPVLVAVCGFCFAVAVVWLTNVARMARQNKWRDLVG